MQVTRASQDYSAHCFCFILALSITPFGQHWMQRLNHSQATCRSRKRSLSMEADPAKLKAFCNSKKAWKQSAGEWIHKLRSSTQHNTVPAERMTPWYRLQHKWTLRTCCSVKKTDRDCLYAMSRSWRATQRGRGLPVARGSGWGQGKDKARASFSRVERALSLPTVRAAGLCEHTENCWIIHGKQASCAAHELHLNEPADSASAVGDKGRWSQDGALASRCLLPAVSVFWVIFKTSPTPFKVRRESILRSCWVKGHCWGAPWWSSGWDCTPNAGGPGSIPGQGTRSHTAQLRVSKPQLKILCAANWKADPACHN